MFSFKALHVDLSIQYNLTCVMILLLSMYYCFVILYVKLFIKFRRFV